MTSIETNNFTGYDDTHNIALRDEHNFLIPQFILKNWDLSDTRALYDYQYNRVYICPNTGKVWAKWQFDPNLKFYPLVVSNSEPPRSLMSHKSLIFSRYDIILLPMELLIKELLMITQKLKDKKCL